MNAECTLITNCLWWNLSMSFTVSAASSVVSLICLPSNKVYHVPVVTLNRHKACYLCQKCKSVICFNSAWTMSNTTALVTRPNVIDRPRLDSTLELVVCFASSMASYNHNQFIILLCHHCAVGNCKTIFSKSCSSTVKTLKVSKMFTITSYYFLIICNF